MINFINFKTLNSLDTLTKYKTFSRYNKVLDKNFKANSLKTFVHKLKHQKQFIKPKFLEEFNRKYPIENQELTKTDLEIKSRNFSKLLEAKKKKRIINIEPWSKSIREFKICEQSPDPMRYTPNYKSVFKTVPSHTFAPLRIKNKNIDKNRKFSQVTQRTKNIIYSLFNKIKSQKKTDNIPSNTLPSTSTISLINKKNNHAYKFGNYIPRKGMPIDSSSDIVSFIEPYNYMTDTNKRKTIDFKKMIDRSKSILINESSLEIPTFNYYNPKYDYVEQKITPILFTHKNIIDENKKSNKFLIHKLWTSYNVTRQYKLVDNDKLSKI